MPAIQSISVMSLDVGRHLKWRRGTDTNHNIWWACQTLQHEDYLSHRINRYIIIAIITLCCKVKICGKLSGVYMLKKTRHLHYHVLQLSASMPNYVWDVIVCWKDMIKLKPRMSFPVCTLVLHYGRWRNPFRDEVSLHHLCRFRHNNTWVKAFHLSCKVELDQFIW